MTSSSPSGEETIISWFQDNEYSGQSRAHIDIVVDAFLDDLVQTSGEIREAAKNGTLVYSRNFSLDGPVFLGNVDLVLGPPVEKPQQQISGVEPQISEGGVGDVWLALNIESLISSIQKNWTNRGRDIHSFYLNIYDEFPTALTGSIILFNSSDLESGDPSDIIDPYRGFELANGSLARKLDSLSVIPMQSAHSSSTVRDDRYIGPDDELHYQNLISTMADGLVKRIEGSIEISEATLEALLSHNESGQLEFKRELSDNRDIAKEGVAMANNRGGRIFFGITDSGEPVGIDDVSENEERVSQILRDRPTPNVVDTIQSHRVEGADILEVKIRPMLDYPASVNGIFYRRSGTTIGKMTGMEIFEEFIQGQP